MAKKSTRPVARRKDADRVTFDDKKYGHTLFSATFEYNELTLARSAELLGLGLKNVRRHVAVTDDAVHVENEDGELGCYSLSELRVVHSTSEFLVADFGEKRYVYVPRSALSENRYRDLVRFLNEKSR